MLFVAIGLGALGLSAMARRSGDRALLWFGIVSVLYGVRLAGSSAPVQLAAGFSPPVWHYWFA